MMAVSGVGTGETEVPGEMATVGGAGEEDGGEGTRASERVTLPVPADVAFSSYTAPPFTRQELCLDLSPL